MAETGNQVSHDASHKHGKKRPKSFYVRSKEGKRIRKDSMLSIGMRGILLTCNHGVKPCIKEAYNLLNEYGDQMYGEEKDEEDWEDVEDGSGSDEEEEDECEDIEASLQKEIAGMKKQRKARQQRFQAVESGAKNVAFIKSKINNSCELVHRILSDIQETKTKKSRHIMRMLPVTATCRSYLEDIEKQAPLVLKPHFEQTDGKVFTFCIMFKVRNCGHLKRDDVITTLHRLVTEMGKHTVNLNHAEKVIMVEVVRNVCCLSVLDDFFKLRKYNLQSITEEFAQDDNLKYRGRKRKFQKKSDNSEMAGDGEAETPANEKVGGDNGNNAENQSDVQDSSADNCDKDIKRQKVESAVTVVSAVNDKSADDIESTAVGDPNPSDTKDDSAGQCDKDSKCQEVESEADVESANVDPKPKKIDAETRETDNLSISNETDKVD